MQEFHYNYIKSKYGDKAEMLWKFETKNVYEDFYKDKNLFDFSNYPKNSKYCNVANNLKTENETSGLHAKYFVESKCKM